MKSIEQRKKTIYNVASAIVQFQNDFFAKGERFLKPLTLKQIAETVGVHESTVSRAINGKYMQCLEEFLSLSISLQAESLMKMVAEFHQIALNL